MSRGEDDCFSLATIAMYVVHSINHSTRSLSPTSRVAFVRDLASDIQIDAAQDTMPYVTAVVFPSPSDMQLEQHRRS